MSIRDLLRAFVLVSALASTAAAQSNVLLEQPPDFTQDGRFSGYDPSGVQTRQRAANRFVLQQPGQPTVIEWTGYSTAIISNQFRVRLFSGDASPGAIVWEGFVDPEASLTGNEVDGRAVVAYSARLEPAPALAAGSYWVSVAGSTSGFIWLRSLPQAAEMAYRVQDSGPWLLQSESAGAAVSLIEAPPGTSTLDLRAGSGPGGDVTVFLEVEIAPNLDPDIAGLDIYRRVLGDCALGQPITDEPVTWPGPGTYGFQPTDVIAEGTIQVYEAVAVDAQRRPMPLDAFEVRRNRAYPHLGSQIVAGRGRLVALGGDALLVPCPGSCWDPLITLRFPQIEPFVDADVDVLITGTVDCDNPRGCVLVGAAQAVDCAIVPTASVSWGALKSRF